MGEAWRTVVVTSERLPDWVRGFESSHGTPEVTSQGRVWTLTSPDGATARLTHPWNDLTTSTLGELVDDLTRDRRLGVVLVRRGAHAVGVFHGRRLVASSVDRHYVQGRTKAGGWSQQRYARRRDNQASKAWAEAAEDAVRLLTAEATLDAVVCAGDREALRAIWSERRLADLRPLVVDRQLQVAEPRRVVLEGFIDAARSMSITLNAQAQLR